MDMMNQNFFAVNRRPVYLYVDGVISQIQTMPMGRGGFGGCTVSIVENDGVDGFIETIGKKYKEKVGHEAEFYVVEIGDGAHVLS